MAEENERHSVLIVGIDGIPGGTAAAATRLEQKFRLPRQVAEKLVASIPAVVKKDVSMDDAQRYAAAIRSIGAAARIVPYSSNKKAKAAVTGILKPRRPRSSLSESKRGDVVRTSGGYITVNKRREPAATLRGEGTQAGGIVPAGSGTTDRTDAAAPVVPESETVIAPSSEVSAPSVQKTVVGTAFDPSAFALPNAFAPPTDPESVPDPFDDSALGSVPSDERFVASMSGDFGAVPSDDFVGASDSLSGSSSGGPAVGDEEVGRPSLFDELMSLDDSGIGPGMGGGAEFGMSQSGEAKGRAAVSKSTHRPTALPSPGAGKPEKEDSLESSGPLEQLAFASTEPEVKSAVEGSPKRLGGFGNLELGVDPADSALQLDTNKPHLTGSFDAIDSGGFSVPAGDEFGLPASPAKAKGTIRMSALSDPLAEEIERTLAQSQPTERIRSALGDPSIDVTGGFSAAAERDRNSNTQFAQVIGWMILLIIVAGGALAGFVFYERWAATLDSKRFAEATNYFEHTVSLDGAADGLESFVRGCAQPDPSVPEFSCRYSQEFYQFYFPEVAADLQNVAPGSCYGTLSESGLSSSEVLDCTVNVTRSNGNASVRFYAASHRSCETSLTALESGDVAECTLRHVVAELAPESAPPNGTEVSASYEFKRPFELDTDVGGVGTREYLVTRADDAGEYHHHAASMGFLVRRAELGGAAGLRLTFADRGGSTSGHQAWPR